MKHLLKELARTLSQRERVAAEQPGLWRTGLPGMFQHQPSPPAGEGAERSEADEGSLKLIRKEPSGAYETETGLSYPSSGPASPGHLLPQGEKVRAEPRGSRRRDR
jgi:hypothetical protein